MSVTKQKNNFEKKRRRKNRIYDHTKKNHENIKERFCTGLKILNFWQNLSQLVKKLNNSKYDKLKNTNTDKLKKIKNKNVKKSFWFKKETKKLQYGSNST